MSPRVLRHPVLAVSVIAALGTATVAPAAVAATTPKPAPVSQQALGGLLGGILGSVTAPVQGLLTPLVTAAGLPAVLPPATIEALTTALTSTVDSLVPADVASLLTMLNPAQVQQLVANPTTVAPLLTGLLSSVTGIVSSGTATATDLTSVLGQLTSVFDSGLLPTSSVGLASVTGVLDQLTKLLTSPTVASLPVVGPLILALAKVGGLVPDGPVKSGVVSAVSAAGTGLGLSPAQIAQALALLGLGRAVAKAPDAATPATTPAAKAAKTVRAKIVSARVSGNRKTVRVQVLCPATATLGCKVRPSVKVGGRTAKVTSSATIARGTTRTFSAKVPAAAVAKAKKAGAKVVVRLATTGSTAGAVTKTVTVRRAG